MQTEIQTRNLEHTARQRKAQRIIMEETEIMRKIEEQRETVFRSAQRIEMLITFIVFVLSAWIVTHVITWTIQMLDEDKFRENLRDYVAYLWDYYGDTKLLTDESIQYMEQIHKIHLEIDLEKSSFDRGNQISMNFDEYKAQNADMFPPPRRFLFYYEQVPITDELIEARMTGKGRIRVLPPKFCRSGMHVVVPPASYSELLAEYSGYCLPLVGPVVAFFDRAMLSVTAMLHNLAIPFSLGAIPALREAFRSGCGFVCGSFVGGIIGIVVWSTLNVLLGQTIDFIDTSFRTTMTSLVKLYETPTGYRAILASSCATSLLLVFVMWITTRKFLVAWHKTLPSQEIYRQSTYVASVTEWIKRIQ